MENHTETYTELTQQIEIHNHKKQQQRPYLIFFSILFGLLTLGYIRFLIVTYNNLGEKFEDLLIFLLLGLIPLSITIISTIFLYLLNKEGDKTFIDLHLDEVITDELKTDTVYDYDLVIEGYYFTYEKDGEIKHVNNEAFMGELVNDLEQLISVNDVCSVNPIKKLLNKEHLQELVNDIIVDMNMDKPELQDEEVKNIEPFKSYLYLKVH